MDERSSIWDQVAVGMRRNRDQPPPRLLSVGRDDRRPFLAYSDTPVLSRLARYAPEADPEAPRWGDPVRQFLGLASDRDTDESTGAFRGVEPKSLATAPRVVVFVHGWVPGSLEVTEEMYIGGGQIAKAWDERIANIVGETMVEEYSPLLAALHERDPDQAVLWYSWVDQSGTDTALFSARGSLQNTSINGRRLAIALQEALGDGEAPIHLIGHSHGSVVATHAAACLGSQVAQLTLLDCPEDWFSRSGGAAGLLDHFLPRLRPGRSPDRVFIDSYASFFGRAYHDAPGLSAVLDVRVTPVVRRGEAASPMSQAHAYAVDWYRESVANPASDVGFAWSPLHGADPTTLGSSYLAVSGERVMELSDWEPGSRADEDDETTTTELAVEPIELTSRSPDVSLLLKLPGDALMVEFDYQINRPGKQTMLAGAVNQRMSFLAAQSYPVPPAGRYLRAEPGSCSVQFRLLDPGLLTTATISGLRVVTSRQAQRNLDDSQAVARIAAISAAAGSVATIATIGAVVAVRGIVRRVLTS